MSSLLGKLEAQWKAGHLRRLEGDLDRFLREHMDDIRTGLAKGHPRTLSVARRRHSRGELSDRDLLDVSVRAFLVRRRSCNPAGDIREQLAEIRRWKPAGSGAAACSEISLSWSTRYARDWREWRVYQLLFIWQKKSDHYLGLMARAA